MTVGSGNLPEVLGCKGSPVALADVDGDPWSAAITINDLS